MSTDPSIFTLYSREFEGLNMENLKIGSQAVNEICEFIFNFAQNNIDLRIEIEQEKIGNSRGRLELNLDTTGGTHPRGFSIPTLQDLQRLASKFPDKVSFNKIAFRTGDGGPNLATGTLENTGLFSCRFSSESDPRVSDFFNGLNSIIANRIGRDEAPSSSFSPG